MSVLPILLLLLTQPSAPDDVLAAYEPGHTTIMVEGAEATFPYRLHRPTTASADNPLPLVIFLHGRSETGNDNQMQLRRFPKQMLTEPHLMRHQAFVLAPQCTGGGWSPRARRGQDPVDPNVPTPSMQALIKKIRELAQDPSVDRSRIYLTGLSMGGFGSWDLAARHPEWFAAVVPICGGGRTATAETLAESDLPIWNFHGDKDSVVDIKYSRNLVNAIRDAGGQAGHTELRGVGHNAWDIAYGPQGGMAWMFAQQRAKPAEIPAEEQATEPPVKN